MVDETTSSVADTGSDTENAVSVSGTTGTTAGGNSQSTFTDLPENLKGKSAAEIAKMHLELEKKLGEQSKEVEAARKVKEQTETMLRAIWADPKLYKDVEAGVQKYVSGDTPKSGESDEEGDRPKVDPGITDLRNAEENRVITDFAMKYGYGALSEEERKDAYARLAVSLGDLVDPGSNKPLKEVLKAIPLTKLPRFLENAHFIANKERFAEDAKRQALITDEENRSASIGSFAASSTKKESSVTLSEREREVAKKQGITEEQYLKQKQTLLKEQDRFK